MASWHQRLTDRKAWEQEQMEALRKRRAERALQQVEEQVEEQAAPLVVSADLLAAQNARARQVRSLSAEEPKPSPQAAAREVKVACGKPVKNSNKKATRPCDKKEKPKREPVEKPKRAPQRKRSSEPRDVIEHVPLKERKRPAATKEQRTEAITRAMDRHKERLAARCMEQQVCDVSSTYPGEGWWTREQLAEICGRNKETIRGWVSLGWLEKQITRCADGQWRYRYRPVKHHTIESLRGTQDYPGDGWYSADSLAQEVGKTITAVREWERRGMLVSERVKGADGRWRIRYQLGEGQTIEGLKAQRVNLGGTAPKDGRAWLTAPKISAAHDLTLNALSWLIEQGLCDVALGGAKGRVAYVAPAEGQTWGDLVEANRERVFNQRIKLAKMGREVYQARQGRRCDEQA